MNESLKNLGTPGDVEAAVRALIPADPGPTEVRDALRKEGLNCSEPTKGVVYCSIPSGRRRWFIKEQWLLEFHFDGDKLDRIEVKKGQTGP